MRLEATENGASSSLANVDLVLSSQQTVVPVFPIRNARTFLSNSKNLGSVDIGTSVVRLGTGTGTGTGAKSDTETGTALERSPGMAYPLTKFNVCGRFATGSCGCETRCN